MRVAVRRSLAAAARAEAGAANSLNDKTRTSTLCFFPVTCWSAVAYETCALQVASIKRITHKKGEVTVRCHFPLKI
jgi:hypothetical protein